MVDDDRYRKYIEAAAVLGQITRARAEEIVRQMMSGGEMQRSQAQSWVDDLIERSRKATGDLLDLVRTEVSSQMEALGLDPDELARHAADILRRSAEAGRRATGGRTTAPSPEPPSAKKRTPAKKASAKNKKASAKKGAAKKSVAAKKASAKKSAAKKSSAKKSAAKKSSAKKGAAKKASAKKTGATRGSTARR